MNPPIVIDVMRGNTVEATHIAYAVAVDFNGNELLSFGDPNYITCFRSSLKPFQAAITIKKGFINLVGFSSKEIALMCASHSGEKIHTDTALSMLTKMGYNEKNLECGAHPSYDSDTHNEMIKRGVIHSAIHNNCSGKHSGMLCLAKGLGVDEKNYIQSHHQVQQNIMEYVEEIAESQAKSYGIDGCSVPTPFYDLRTIANMYMKLTSGKKAELNKVFKCMSDNPYLIAGKDRFDTDFTKILKGKAVAKGGGEAIQGIAFNSKKYGPIGIALKVIDGSHRVRDVANMYVLNTLELLTDEEKLHLHPYSEKPILNHNKIETGKIKVRG